MEGMRIVTVQYFSRTAVCTLYVGQSRDFFPVCCNQHHHWSRVRIHSWIQRATSIIIALRLFLFVWYQSCHWLCDVSLRAISVCRVIGLLCVARTICDAYLPVRPSVCSSVCLTCSGSVSVRLNRSWNFCSSKSLISSFLYVTKTKPFRFVERYTLNCSATSLSEYHIVRHKSDHPSLIFHLFCEIRKLPVL